MNYPVVGGDPATIEAGSQGLSTEAGKIPSVSAMVATTCTSCSTALARPEPADMVARFSTAWSTYLDDLQVHMVAAARLVQFGSEDLTAATGGPSAGPSAGPRPR